MEKSNRTTANKNTLLETTDTQDMSRGEPDAAEERRGTLGGRAGDTPGMQGRGADREYAQGRVTAYSQMEAVNGAPSSRIGGR